MVSPPCSLFDSFSVDKTSTKAQVETESVRSCVNTNRHLLSSVFAVLIDAITVRFAAPNFIFSINIYVLFARGVRHLSYDIALLSCLLIEHLTEQVITRLIGPKIVTD